MLIWGISFPGYFSTDLKFVRNAACFQGGSFHHHTVCPKYSFGKRVDAGATKHTGSERLGQIAAATSTAPATRLLRASTGLCWKQGAATLGHPFCRATPCEGPPCPGTPGADLPCCTVFPHLLCVPGASSTSLWKQKSGWEWETRHDSE